MTDIITVEIPTEITNISVIESAAITVEAGLQGPAGPAGQSDFPDGDDGDIIRFNAATGQWESCAEPFEFQGIILVPMLAPESADEGFLFYNALDDSVYVAVE